MQINCEIVLDILRKPPGFHTTAREPKRAVGSDASNTIKIPQEDPQREKKSENGSGREKEGRNFGRSGGGAPRRLVSRRVVPRRVGAPKGGGLQMFAFSPLPPLFSFFSSLLGSSRSLLSPRRPQSGPGSHDSPRTPNVHI